MNQTELLTVAFAEQCRSRILEKRPHEAGLPAALGPKHLLWMCDVIDRHAEDWPATKLHRWLGFVQAGMLANRVLDLSEARSMFDNAKNAYGEVRDDQDLLDHLDSSGSYEIELGGQG